MTEDYDVHHSRFTGRIVKVTVQTGAPKLSAQDQKAIDESAKNAESVTE